MPTYDYKCETCGHKFEAFPSITAEPIKICPVCKKNKVRRLIGLGGGVIFKGAGFYCNDYRESGPKTATKSKKTETAATSAESAAKTTDTKSDTAK